MNYPISQQNIKHLVLTPKFIIIGIKHDGYRKLPPTYDNVIEIANSRKELFEICLKLEQFRVFEFGKPYKDFETITSKAKIYEKQLQESNERKQYEKLKEKFEK